MGLDTQLFKGIKRRGYAVPTPIQRKAIPPAQAGNDLIVVGRTGSGKSACFLIPLINTLKEHSMTVGVRGVVLSPTRELALQTLKFALDLGKFTSLKFCALVGGDGLKQEFSKLAENPDIVIATPGRLMHFILELEFTLGLVECVVLDEADRLLCQGFTEQVKTILLAMTRETKQVLCYSATMPESLSDFTRTGLSNPILIKLDQEHKLPHELKLQFFIVRTEDKVAGLLLLLRKIKGRVLVFTATRYHVEYLEFMLGTLGFSVVGMHGNMDQETRRKALKLFITGKRTVLVTTDLSARGIDIPALDYVIHFDFPDTPKLFIHRSGRAARAGRSGTCFSLVSYIEIPYLIEVQTHLALTSTLNVGTVDEDTITSLQEELKTHMREINITEHDLKLKTMTNSVKAYKRTRQPASDESVRRAKTFKLCPHPLFSTVKSGLLEQLRDFRPSTTVLEYSAMKTNNNELLARVKKPELRHRARTATRVLGPAEVSSLEHLVKAQFSKRGELAEFKNPEYISYQGTRFFEKDCDFSQITMELPVSDDLALSRSPKTVWDNTKKKYIQQVTKKQTFLVNDKAKKLYKEWTKQTKKRIQHAGEVEDPNNSTARTGHSRPPAELKFHAKTHKKYRSKPNKRRK